LNLELRWHRVRCTSSQCSAHIFKESHLTLMNASPNASSNRIVAKRFPVSRKVRSPFKGRQISETVINEENRFRDKSRELIRGQTASISEYVLENLINMPSRITVSSSRRLLDQSDYTRRLRPIIPLLLLDSIKPNHLDFSPFGINDNPLMFTS
jgi:hypothetical protein